MVWELVPSLLAAFVFRRGPSHPAGTNPDDRRCQRKLRYSEFGSLGLVWSVQNFMMAFLTNLNWKREESFQYYPNVQKNSKIIIHRAPLTLKSKKVTSEGFKKHPQIFFSLYRRGRHVWLSRWETTEFGGFFFIKSRNYTRAEKWIRLMKLTNNRKECAAALGMINIAEQKKEKKTINSLPSDSILKDCHYLRAWENKPIVVHDVRCLI